MPSNTMRCRYCGEYITVSHYKNTSQSPPRHSTFQVQHSDSLSQAHNSIHHATRKIKDMFHKSPSNTLAATGNSCCGPGTSSFAYYPKPAGPSASPVPSTAHGPKRALLCGVSYYGQKYRLHGSVNDVKCMQYFLTQKLGFPSDSILILTEDQSNPHLIPTKNNIRKALRWLVQGCKSGDSLVFYYSGHGSQQPDFNRDEVDGHDEILWPVDHQTQGAIVDDELNATIVRPLTKGVKLHAIVDACHSGTILDLPLVCRIKRDGFYMWEDQGSQSSVYTGTSGGLAISFSSCDDHQISVDTTALSGDTATGAMTYSFIQAVQNEPGLTYGQLVHAMRRTIRGVQKGFIGSLAKKVLTPELTQVNLTGNIGRACRRICYGIITKASPGLGAAIAMNNIILRAVRLLHEVFCRPTLRTRSSSRHIMLFALSKLNINPTNSALSKREPQLSSTERFDIYSRKFAM